MPKRVSRRSTLALAQMAVSKRPAENLRAAEAWVGKARKAGAQIVCLPELFMTPYFCQREDPATFDLAEPVPGPTTRAMQKAARKHRIAVVVPVFERRAAGVYHNSAAIVDADGSIAGLYRKMHIPDDPSYYEKYYFAPGDLGFQAVRTAAGPVGVLICWDQWYPEAARLTALRGAATIFFPTAIGWHPHEKKEHGPAQLDAWKTAQRAHAIANGVYVAVANRVGPEKPDGGGAGLAFWGHSFACDPFGRVLCEAPHQREELLVAETDAAHAERVRRHWPFLRDRRIDAYGGIAERYLGETP
ncbi:MAG: carbon-nitrogen hydrolase [Planctomycetota bacterium]|nr:carbon-nitrogen hydrolase [Planctomycetota bacterium]